MKSKRKYCLGSLGRSIRRIKKYGLFKIQTSSCIADLLSDILGNRRIYYLIIKNEELLHGLHQLAISSLTSHRAGKELLKVLVKFNENLLKDVNGIATTSHNSNTELQYIYSNYLVHNTSQVDEESSLIKSHSNDNFDICNFTYVFVIVSQTIEAVAKDFVEDSEERYLVNTYSQKKKMLGLRRILEFEYVYNILEIIINANSNVSLSQNKNLILLTEKIIASKILRKMIVNNILI
jgi:hypothetical protein